MRLINNFFRLAWRALLFSVLAGTLSAYVTIRDSSDIYVVVWPPGSISMQIKLPAPPAPLLDGNTSYAPPIRAAMQLWNKQIGQVNLQGTDATPGSYANGNDINEIVMDSKVDGENFSANTLAVSLSYRIGNVRTESDVVFNTAYTWDSYRGNLRSGREDIQRVAVHEFGHVLGLDHPNEATPVQAVASIMNSRAGNVEVPLQDDINGARSLYGAPGFVPANDNFLSAAVLTVTGSSAQAIGTNIGATAERNEPNHADEKATHSVWWRWTASTGTPVTLTTFGSNFDTVVGVYTGANVDQLTSVASNDDEDRGVIRSSKLTFTPTAGVTYYVAVDGWDGSFGQITIDLTLGDSSGPAPTITTQPTDHRVPEGGSATFNVAASGAPSSYQWFYNGTALSGETTDTLALSKVSNAQAGNYYVIVNNAAGSVTSGAASLVVFQPVVTEQTVTNGHEVTLTAPELSGSYRWQVSSDRGASWHDLGNDATYAGVTTATLTIGNAGLNLDGNQYRYVVSNDGGTTSSSGISLSVGANLIPFPVAIAVDGSGNLYVADSSTHVIQKITTANRVSTVAGVAGSAGSTDGVAATARFNQPSGITSSVAGVLTVADTANALIRRITSTGTVTTLAGSATARGSANGTGAAATFAMPIGIAQTQDGLFVIADGTNHIIRQMTGDNTVSNLAGSSEMSGSTDGAGTAARFNYPTGIATDGAGNSYVADTTNNLIRKITPAGNVTTLAGVVAVSGWQDGEGTGALFNQPGGVAVDGAGNIYVADKGNSVIRKITPHGTVSTLAGLSTVGGLQDGNGSAAWFNQPRDLAVDGSGNVYVADTGNAAIRKITPEGLVTTLKLSAAPTGSTGGNTGGGSTGGGTTAPPSSSGGGGGGGGGGAPSWWFFAAAALLAWARWSRRQRHPKAETSAR